VVSATGTRSAAARLLARLARIEQHLGRHDDELAELRTAHRRAAVERTLAAKRAVAAVEDAGIGQLTASERRAVLRWKNGEVLRARADTVERLIARSGGDPTIVASLIEAEGEGGEGE
jgi:hypothetical protein